MKKFSRIRQTEKFCSNLSDVFFVNYVAGTTFLYEMFVLFRQKIKVIFNSTCYAHAKEATGSRQPFEQQKYILFFHH